MCQWEHSPVLVPGKSWGAFVPRCTGIHKYLLLLPCAGSKTRGQFLANCARADCCLGLGLVRKARDNLGQQPAQPHQLNQPASHSWRPSAPHIVTNISAFQSVLMFWLGFGFPFPDRNMSINKFPLLLDFFQLPSQNRKSFLSKILDKLLVLFIHKKITQTDFYIYLRVCV